MSWQLLTMFLAAVAVIAIVALTTAQYSRVETASGQIVAKGRIATLVAPRPGQVMQLEAREGMVVKRGEQLLLVSNDAHSVGGELSGAQLRDKINTQQALVVAQELAKQVEDAALRSQLQSEIGAVRGQIATTTEQVTLQSRLLESAIEELATLQGVADRGFVTKRELRAREEQIISRRQSLLALQQQLAKSRSDLKTAVYQLSQVDARSDREMADLNNRKLDLEIQAISLENDRSFSIRAPVSGRVTAINVKEGQRVESNLQLLSIVPNGAELEVDLAVPGQAIGFVKKGDQVRLAIESYPYQRFGKISGEVTSVAVSPVFVNSGGASVAIYPAKVKLGRSFLMAYGKREPLLPGMAVSATIIAEKQSLFRWLLEPLYAVRER